MNKFENISNTDLTRLIDEWVKGERDRKILKRRLIDCVCYEPLAEEFELSVKRVKSIVYQNEKIILKHIPHKMYADEAVAENCFCV